ncbi:[FeFe] hydrogenase H-cluster maturation GTPase HydF [Pseudoflavonifractor sp. DSM 107456]|uniref:[FeFe] hydrogenase H-cluster maturation GTPase HydF n=1 Tax=Pseudoflavonifractor gallinarum TaxID=2779352 RepID=A0ABR9R9D0_9FIRM|nr:[FeFe] hydrogenase H-cluster maturation GTPase HydF [Pseudoflavonifractor gallinarum]MBE5055302.1 [FeFe] hydrogenase H-cluster maturation GTPase HydF [Pseudoflavonifractor gallinarum]
MSLNDTPSGERLRIAFLGRRNVGKSSLVNAFTGQDLSIVSDTKGTTTDPVYKAMELLPLGPVQIIDTPGFDDEGELGALRVRRTKQVLNKADLAILVADATQPLGPQEQEWLALIRERQIPFLLVWNKADLLPAVPPPEEHAIWTSAQTGLHIHELREAAAKAAVQEQPKRHLVADLLETGDTVVLVVPLDGSAPKGRLILPQQQTIRDCLEAGACVMVCRDTELPLLLDKLGQPPKLVITDSQVFASVSKMVPPSVWLTSFSILMARYKGDLALTTQGAQAVSQLRDGDKVLIAEGCTHHRQCEDIGTVKLPRWVRKFTGVEPAFTFCSGRDFPEDLSEYKLVIHCGGCTLGEKEMKFRQRTAADQGVPITNYGILIAYLNGILPRTLEPFAASGAPL